MIRKLMAFIFSHKKIEFIPYDIFCRGLSDSELITLQSLVHARPGIPDYWPESKKFILDRAAIMRECIEQELYMRTKNFVTTNGDR